MLAEEVAEEIVALTAAVVQAAVVEGVQTQPTLPKLVLQTEEVAAVALEIILTLLLAAAQVSSSSVMRFKGE